MTCKSRPVPARCSASAFRRPSRRSPKSRSFLVGTQGRCDIVDVSTAKKIELRVHTPLRKNPYPEAGLHRPAAGARTRRADSAAPHHARLLQHPLRRGGDDLLAARKISRPGRGDRMPPRLARTRRAARCRGSAEARRTARRRLLDQSRAGHRHRLGGTRGDAVHARKA